MTWNDGNETYLPGTTMTIVLKHSVFIIVRGDNGASAGINCNGSGVNTSDEIVLAAPAVNAPHDIALASGELTPVLPRGTYTVGLTAKCVSHINDPAATYLVSPTVLEVDVIQAK